MCACWGASVEKREEKEGEEQESEEECDEEENAYFRPTVI